MVGKFAKQLFDYILVFHFNSFTKDVMVLMLMGNSLFVLR